MRKKMDISIAELAVVLSGANKPATKTDLGFRIVVLDRGFVYCGKTVIEGDFVTITDCKNIRQWGTKKGLGEIAESGPTSATVMDSVGEIVAPLRAVISFIKCNRSYGYGDGDGSGDGSGDG